MRATRVSPTPTTRALSLIVSFAGTTSSSNEDERTCSVTFLPTFVPLLTPTFTWSEALRPRSIEYGALAPPPDPPTTFIPTLRQVVVPTFFNSTSTRRVPSDGTVEGFPTAFNARSQNEKTARTPRMLLDASASPGAETLNFTTSSSRRITRRGHRHRVRRARCRRARSPA